MAHNIVSETMNPMHIFGIRAKRTESHLRPKVIVVRLSELLRGEEVELPALCRAAHSVSRGRETCKNVTKYVQLLLTEVGRTPFVFCCCWALKVLVIPTGDEDAFLVFTRSPVPDYKHLGFVAELIGFSDAEEVKEKLWSRVRSLCTELVNDTIDRLNQLTNASGENPLSKDQVETLRALGAAYDRRHPYDVPAFDVVLHNVLQDSVLDKKGNTGYMRISASAKIDGKVRVLRLVIKQLGTHDTFELPIVGLVVQNAASGDLEVMLDRMANVLLGKWTEKRVESFQLAGDQVWNADVGLYAESKDGSRLAKETRRIAEVGLSMANNTIRNVFIEKLHATDNGASHEFPDWVKAFCEADVRSIAGMDRGILWIQVLKDLWHILDSLPGNHATALFREKVRTVDEVLQIPEHYSPLVPDIQVSDEIRREALRRDILGGSSRYKEMFDGQFIQRTLVESAFNSDLVTYFARAYAQRTEESFIDATRSGQITLDDEPGRTAWSIFFRECDDWARCDLVEEAEANLYEITESERGQRMMNMRAQLAGVLWKSITFGLALGYPMINDVRRKAHHRYRLKRLKTPDTEADNGSCG